MNCKNQCGFSLGILIEIIISIIFGSVVGILLGTEIILSVTTAIPIAFGIAILLLIFLIAGLFLAIIRSTSSLSCCLCQNTITLLVGIIGTILFSLAAFSTFSIPILTTIILAIGAFFFALMLMAFFNLINCIILEI